MKKFLIASGTILSVIVVLFITLACIKPQPKFSYGEPSQIYIYAKSSSAVQNGKGESSFSPSSETYKSVLKKTNEILKVSMFDNAVHGNVVYSTVGQDDSGQYSSYSSSMLSSKYYAVSFSFEDSQKQVVVCNGDKRTIEYKRFILLLDPDQDYQTALVYFSTSDSLSSAKNPMLVNVRASKLIKYIDEIK